MKKIAFLWLVFILLLSACEGPPPPTPMPPTETPTVFDIEIEVEPDAVDVCSVFIRPAMGGRGSEIDAANVDWGEDWIGGVGERITAGSSRRFNVEGGIYRVHLRSCANRDLLTEWRIGRQNASIIVEKVAP